MLVRLLALLLLPLPGRLVSLFPSRLLAAAGTAGQPAPDLVRRVDGTQLAGRGADRRGAEPSLQPQGGSAAHQADLTVLLIPCVPAAQQAGVTCPAFLLAGLSQAQQAALAVPRVSQVTSRKSQGPWSCSCVMVWPRWWLGLYAGGWEAWSLVLNIPGSRLPVSTLEEGGGQLIWLIQGEGALGGL